MGILNTIKVLSLKIFNLKRGCKVIVSKHDFFVFDGEVFSEETLTTFVDRVVTHDTISVRRRKRRIVFFDGVVARIFFLFLGSMSILVTCFILAAPFGRIIWMIMTF